MNKPIPTCRDPWARWAKIIFAIVVCATLLAVSGCQRVDTAKREHAYASGTKPEVTVINMQLWIDAETKCEYLVPRGSVQGGEGGITPRMSRDGKQVCK